MQLPPLHGCTDPDFKLSASVTLPFFIPEGRVGFIVPVEGTTDQFVVGVERKFLIVQWDGKDGSPAKTVRELSEVDRTTKNRINDGKADPRGRLYGGKKTSTFGGSAALHPKTGLTRRL